MMQKGISIVAVLFLLALAAGSCEKSAPNQNDPETPAGQGILRISLTDAPGDFEAVNITFSEIRAHIDSQWVAVQDTPKTINLLEWNNGQSIVIGTAEVPAGHYSQIRLKIDSAEVVVNGITHPLDVPSGAQTGLKLNAHFMVAGGSTYELVIDFDVNRSIVVTGPPHNPRYKLKPVIRVAPKAITGSISGTVLNYQDLPVAYAIQDADTVTSSLVSGDTGKFMLAFLPAGFYTVSIEDTAGLSFTKDSVEVVAGTDKDLGLITLQ
ncbi:MAG: DUF4382 domain-containing protein [Calditrichaceae bacterium]|nr:DUF4382 domain-containing protein [Calditrichia bacterium]NUQ44345.1 DUF4382 domain-containing protein [Calditrichaceae bacterium]